MRRKPTVVKIERELFYHYCQKCNLYNPIKGGKPARTNNKKQKLDKVRQKEGYNYD